MGRLNILPILLLVVCIWYSSAQDWDYILFSQCWPTTVCKLLMESDVTHTCSLPRNQKAWTIHGIWPTIEGSKGPAFCNQSWLFDLKEVKPLVSQLEQRWINILKEAPIHDLWAHEWNKHGTCGAIKHLNSQIKYFSTGLNWLQKYTMTNILSEADIFPCDSKSYTRNEIYLAIKNKLGVNPEIKCENVKGKQYLVEIRICFSRSLEIIDCKHKECVRNIYSDVDIISNCHSNGILYS